MKILLSGASGFLGTSLLRSFSSHQIQSLRLVRKNPDGLDIIRWNPNAAEPITDPALVENASAAIHLSGANLSAHRWTAGWKREIAESRIQSTRALVNLLKTLKQPPQSLLCASAIGIYGNRAEEILSESSPPGQGFLADTCRAWEAEAGLATEAGLRVVHLRFGVVLSPAGGALRQMLPIFRAGLGGRLGTGFQWFSWIAIDDLTRAVLHILHTKSLAGPVNLVSPLPVTNAEFTRALSRALHRPAILPVPRPVLRAAFGEMADAALLASTRVVPQCLAASGFRFLYPHIDSALQSMV
jgi:uncharacterized protein